MTTRNLDIPDELAAELARTGANFTRRGKALDDEDDSAAKRVENLTVGAAALLQVELDQSRKRDEERGQHEDIRRRAARMLDVTSPEESPTEETEGSGEGNDGEVEQTQPEPEPEPEPESINVPQEQPRRYQVADSLLGVILAIIAALLIFAIGYNWVVSDIVWTPPSMAWAFIRAAVLVAAVYYGALLSGTFGDFIDSRRTQWVQRSH